MRAIQKKIRSRRGASITFALLLFLVCAVLSSVVIVAATTASGRMSGLAETDQRYYAVSSAAELMKELMKDRLVSVVTVTTRYSAITYRDGIPGDPVENSNGVSNNVKPVTKNYLLMDTAADASEIDTAALDDYEVSRVKNDSVQNLAGYAYLCGLPENTELTPPANKELSLTVSDAPSAAIESLAVSIEASFDGNGNITLTISNTGDNPFRQQLVLHANMSTSLYMSAEELAPVPGDPPESVETIPTKTTEIVVSTLSWDT